MCSGEITSFNIFVVEYVQKRVTCGFHTWNSRDFSFSVGTGSLLVGYDWPVQISSLLNMKTEIDESVLCDMSTDE